MGPNRVKEILYLSAILILLFLLLIPSILHADEPVASLSPEDLLVPKRISISRTLNFGQDYEVPFSRKIFPPVLQQKFEKQRGQYLAIEYMYYSKPMGLDTIDGTETLSSQLAEDCAKNIVGSVIKYHIMKFLTFDKLNMEIISSSQAPMPTIITKENYTTYTYFTPLSFTNLSLANLSQLFSFKNYKLKTFLYGFQVDPGPTMLLRHISPICYFTFGYNVLNGAKTIGLEKPITKRINLQASVARVFDSENRKIMAGITIEF